MESARPYADGVRDNDEHAYDVMTDRRLHHDNLVWQVPVLSMTAQSFLFTIALGAGTTPVARTIACALSFTISVMSANLMIRHRGFELSTAKWLETFESDNKVRLHHGRPPVYDGPAVLRVLNRSAYRMWLWGLVVFGLAAILTAVFTWVPIGWLR